MSLLDKFLSWLIAPSLIESYPEMLKEEKVLLKTNPIRQVNFGDSEVIDEVKMSKNDLIVHLVEKRMSKKTPGNRRLNWGEWKEIKEIASER